MTSEQLDKLLQIAEQGRLECERNYRTFGVASFARKQTIIWTNLLDELQRLKAVPGESK